MTDTTYRLDATHPGITLVSMAVVAIGAAAGVLVIVPAVAGLLGARESVPVFLSCAGGAAIGIGAGWAAEHYLRSIWPSGRWLKVTEEGITLLERSGTRVHIAWAEPADMLAWHFVIRDAKRRVPKGWYCVAGRLAQEGKVIAPYAFMRPEDAEAMPQWKGFPELFRLKQTPDEYPRRAVGTQEKLREAEQDRWNDGAEMASADFAALAAELDRRLPGWLG